MYYQPLGELHRQVLFFFNECTESSKQQETRVFSFIAYQKLQYSHYLVDQLTFQFSKSSISCKHVWTKSQTKKEETNKAACLIVKDCPNYLEGRTDWGTKGVYAVSRSAASRWAFWNSLSTAWKSFASLASAIFLLAWN